LNNIQTKHILVLLTNAYSNDPRVSRECVTLTKVGYQVTVLAWDRSGGDFSSHEVIDGVTVRRLALHSLPDTGLNQMFALARYWLWVVLTAASMQIHVVHCHDLDTTPAGWLTALVKRAKLTFDAHENFATQVRITSGAWVGRIADRLEQFIVPRANAIITVGNRLGDFMKTEGARQVVIVHNSYEKDDFDFPPEILKRKKAELKLNANAITVCYLGAFTKTRYIDLLLEASAMQPGVNLLLAGQGPLEPMVRTYAERYPQIRFLGFISPEEVALLTCVSDVIYCCYNPDDPNNYFSMPNKFFQALAAGKPCIATRGTGELGEWIERYDLGVLIDHENVTQVAQAFDVLVEKNLIARYQANMRIAFENEGFNWNTSKERLLALYSQLLSKE
jgi:glycosyltransferase involved in cell wall biosynthesis